MANGKQSLRSYSKPILTSFGLIKDLTANFSGIMEEQSMDCSQSAKNYIPACGMEGAGPQRR